MNLPIKLKRLLAQIPFQVLVEIRNDDGYTADVEKWKADMILETRKTRRLLSQQEQDLATHSPFCFSVFYENGEGPSMASQARQLIAS